MDLFQLYCDQIFTFQKDAFKFLNCLVDCTHGTISMKWITNLNTKVDHLTFNFGHQHICTKLKDQAFGHISFVIPKVYAKAIVEVKGSYLSIANNLVNELGNQSLLMNQLMFLTRFIFGIGQVLTLNQHCSYI